MARIRSVKPEFWADRTLARVSRDARLLYIGLWNYADEHARLHGDERFIKGHLLPYEDDLTLHDVAGLLAELVGIGSVVRYEAAGNPYLFLPKLSKHQRLEPGKVASRLPEPPDPGPSGGRGAGVDGSARRADESAPRSDIHSPSGGAVVENPQVNGTTALGADKSARGADSSAPIVAQQVAGSMLQVAGSRQQAAGTTAAAAAADELPGTLEILRAKLNAARLVVRWDKLTAEQTAAIEALVATHGDAALVKAALLSYQANNPPVYAQAWLQAWAALPAPGEHLRLVPDRCPDHHLDQPCGMCAADAKAGAAGALDGAGRHA